MNGSFGRLAIITACALLGAACGRSRDQQAEQFSAVVQRYCLDCHDAAGEEAGLSLEHADLKDIGPHAEVWEKVARKLRGRMMPPAGRGRVPTKRPMTASSRLSRRTSTRPRKRHPNPGHASIRRLNRTEYGNAVRELLALDVDASELLPADDEGYGFDNIAGVLRVSPSLLEQYLAASREGQRRSRSATGALTRSRRSIARRRDVRRPSTSRDCRSARAAASRSTTTSRSTASTSSTLSSCATSSAT